MTKNDGINLLGRLATGLTITQGNHDAETVAARNREFLRLSRPLLNYSAKTPEFREAANEARAIASVVAKEISEMAEKLSAK